MVLNLCGMARPSLYTQQLADEICERIAAGESLRKICIDKHMPSAVTAHAWLNRADSAFLKQYVRARDCQADLYAEQIITIADGVADNEQTQRDRLRVDARKWVAARLAPKKYGDRVLTELSGPEGKPFVVAGIDAPRSETREEWEARRAALKLNGTNGTNGTHTNGAGS